MKAIHMQSWGLPNRRATRLALAVLTVGTATNPDQSLPTELGRSSLSFSLAVSAVCRWSNATVSHCGDEVALDNDPVTSRC
jgi:hypothetical protein